MKNTSIKICKQCGGSYSSKAKLFCSNSCRGLGFSEEQRRKMSLARMGKSPWNKGKKVSPEIAQKIWATRRKLNHIGIKKGSESPNWTGEKIGYTGMHSRLRRQLGRATYCTFDKSHTSTRFEWANISHEYKPDLSDFMPLCPPCHRKYDDHVFLRRKDLYVS